MEVAMIKIEVNYESTRSKADALIRQLRTEQGVINRSHRNILENLDTQTEGQTNYFVMTATGSKNKGVSSTTAVADKLLTFINNSSSKVEEEEAVIAGSFDLGLHLSP
jgi:hypothetical protein